MITRPKSTLLAWPLALLVLAAAAAAAPAQDRSGGLREQLGPRFQPEQAAHGAARHARRHWAISETAVRRWNDIAIDTTGIDHTPVAAGQARVFGEQFGPVRAARAMAIVHIAIFDAVNAIAGGYRSYTGQPRVTQATAIEAAVAQAAHDTLVALFPSQTASLDELLAEDLGRHRLLQPAVKAAGIALGRRTAAAVLALRADDGSQHAEPRMGDDYVPGNQPGLWRQDPVSQIPLAMGAHWGVVKPFVMSSGQQFRLPPPPDMGSAEYTAAFDEVKRLGGDGITTPTLRTAQETVAAIFCGPCPDHDRFDWRCQARAELGRLGQ